MLLEPAARKKLRQHTKQVRPTMLDTKTTNTKIIGLELKCAGKLQYFSPCGHYTNKDRGLGEGKG